MRVSQAASRTPNWSLGTRPRVGSLAVSAVGLRSRQQESSRFGLRHQTLIQESLNDVSHGQDVVAVARPWLRGAEWPGAGDELGDGATARWVHCRTRRRNRTDVARVTDAVLAAVAAARSRLVAGEVDHNAWLGRTQRGGDHRFAARGVTEGTAIVADGTDGQYP